MCEALTLVPGTENEGDDPGKRRGGMVMPLPNIKS